MTNLIKIFWKLLLSSYAPKNFRNWLRLAKRAAEGKYGTTSHLEKLIQDNPQFHLYQGKLTSWSIHSDTLRYLYNLLAPGMVTLETGCGQSTVIYAIARTSHTCIMPNSEEAERVKDYCINLGIAFNIKFIISSSDSALPSHKQEFSELDHVLIDGAHAFPAPIIDWHYTARNLKIGGTLGVDDYRMPSVKILYDFLRTEDEEWEFIRIVQNTAFFKKLRQPRDLVHWNGQKINARYPGY